MLAAEFVGTENLLGQKRHVFYGGCKVLASNVPVATIDDYRTNPTGLLEFLADEEMPVNIKKALDSLVATLKSPLELARDGRIVFVNHPLHAYDHVAACAQRFFYPVVQLCSKQRELKPQGAQLGQQLKEKDKPAKKEWEKYVIKQDRQNRVPEEREKPKVDLATLRSRYRLVSKQVSSASTRAPSVATGLGKLACLLTQQAHMPELVVATGISAESASCCLDGMVHDADTIAFSPNKWAIMEDVVEPSAAKRRQQHVPEPSGWQAAPAPVLAGGAMHVGSAGASSGLRRIAANGSGGGNSLTAGVCPSRGVCVSAVGTASTSAAAESTPSCSYVDAVTKAGNGDPLVGIFILGRRHGKRIVSAFTTAFKELLDLDADAAAGGGGGDSGSESSTSGPPRDVHAWLTRTFNNLQRSQPAVDAGYTIRLPGELRKKAGEVEQRCAAVLQKLADTVEQQPEAEAKLEARFIKAWEARVDAATANPEAARGNALTDLAHLLMIHDFALWATKPIADSMRHSRSLNALAFVDRSKRSIWPPAPGTILDGVLTGAHEMLSLAIRRGGMAAKQMTEAEKEMSGIPGRKDPRAIAAFMSLLGCADADDLMAELLAQSPCDAKRQLDNIKRAVQADARVAHEEQLGDVQPYTLSVSTHGVKQMEELLRGLMRPKDTATVLQLTPSSAPASKAVAPVATACTGPIFVVMMPSAPSSDERKDIMGLLPEAADIAAAEAMEAITESVMTEEEIKAAELARQERIEAERYGALSPVPSDLVKGMKNFNLGGGLEGVAEKAPISSLYINPYFWASCDSGSGAAAGAGMLSGDGGGPVVRGGAGGYKGDAPVAAPRRASAG